MRDKLKSDVSSAVTKVAGVEKVELEFGVMNETQRDNVKNFSAAVGRSSFHLLNLIP